MYCQKKSTNEMKYSTDEFTQPSPPGSMTTRLSAISKPALPCVHYIHYIPGGASPAPPRPAPRALLHYHSQTACIFIVPLVDKYRALLTDGPAGPEAALIRNLVVPTLDSGATSLV